jgi:hypothetical protein
VSARTANLPCLLEFELILPSRGSKRSCCPAGTNDRAVARNERGESRPVSRPSGGWPNTGRKPCGPDLRYWHRPQARPRPLVSFARRHTQSPDSCHGTVIRASRSQFCLRPVEPWNRRKPRQSGQIGRYGEDVDGEPMLGLRGFTSGTVERRIGRVQRPDLNWEVTSWI